jgi:hypothetical protein
VTTETWIHYASRTDFRVAAVRTQLLAHTVTV